MALQRNTVQLAKITECLKGVKTHPTAETVYCALKDELPGVTLATVYRNLHKLAGNGSILKFKSGNEFRFDGDTSMHQHCICNGCGSVMDYFDESISKSALKKFASPSFSPSSVNILYNGTCRKCRKAKR